MNLGAALRSAAPSLAQALTLRENLAQKYANDELERERNLASLENMRTDNALKQAQLEAAQALKDEQTKKLNEQNSRLAAERPKITEALANLKLDLARSNGADPESMAINKAMAQGPTTWAGNMSATPELQAQAEKPGFGDLLKKQQEGQILASPAPAKASSALDALANLNPPTEFMKPRDINPLLAKKQFREYGLTSGIATSELPEAKAATSELDKLAAADEKQRQLNEQIAARQSAAGAKADLKLDEGDKRYYGQMVRDLSTKLNSSRTQLGILVNVANQANRDLSAIDSAIRGGKGDVIPTKQIWRELNTGLARILGSSNAVSQIDELTATSAASDIKNKLQYLQDSPQAAISKDWLKQLRDSFERISSISNATLDEMAENEADVRAYGMPEQDAEKLRSYAKNYIRNIKYKGESEAKTETALPENKQKRLEELRAKKAAGTLGK